MKEIELELGEVQDWIFNVSTLIEFAEANFRGRMIDKKEYDHYMSLIDSLVSTLNLCYKK